MQQPGPWGYPDPSYPNPNPYGGYAPPMPPPPQQQYQPYHPHPHPHTPPPPYQHQQSPFYGQGPGYGAPPPPPMPQAAPGTFELHFFRDGRKTQTVRAPGRADALLVLTLPGFDKLEITARRGHAMGETVGTGRLHDLTTSKADMTLWGRHVRWKAEYDSLTGLGHLHWQPGADKGFVLEGNGRMLARYSVVGGTRDRVKAKLHGLLSTGRQLGLPGTSSLGGGGGGSAEEQQQEAEARLEIFAQGLSREQLEEIVISCVVERERFTKGQRDKKDAKLIGKIYGDFGDSGDAGGDAGGF